MFVLHDIEEMRHLMIASTPALLLDLHGVGIHQIDIAERLIIISTIEQRILLFNLDDSSVCPIGKVSRAKRKTRDRFQASGVCALFTYRLVELNTFNYEPDYYNEEWAPTTKAYRLVSTDCHLFATRPKCRLWAADLEGKVQFTHQFGELIDDLTDSLVFGDELALSRVFTKDQQIESIQFGKLYSMYWRDLCDSLQVYNFLVTYSADCCPSRLLC